MSVFENNKPSLFFDFGVPLGSNQIRLIEEDFETIARTSSDKWKVMFFRYFDYFAYTRYGCLEFILDDAVLDLSQDEQEKIDEALGEIVRETEWYGNFSYMHDIEEILDSCSQDEFDDNNYLEDYVESNIACGYKVSEKELIEIFARQLTKEEVVKKTLFLKIKYVDDWTE